MKHRRAARTALAAFALVGCGEVAVAGDAPPAPAEVARTGSNAGADAKRGERLFLQCRACHSLGAARDGKVGPPLGGFLSRPAGTLQDYAYSKALAASGLRWDEATLDAWLRQPSTVVPGTAWVFAGIAKADDRRQLADYLKRATGTG